ncbi:glutaredoxin [Fadolivirus algeromassiliense]|jgi:glutaredoxin|uniref:Glutaredoxin n=1 Tax=Fadolivirus FV1/VV64 TaxID=3070911 RepID=A0A7D3UVK7_9VIRU|nr:glutaredoxin [Fadolivirus algeromassiliense]QKF94114.1 glutaredoxin [Fadolivirus FV1/VV64]
MDKYNKKIDLYKNNDIYIIFYSPTCKYSLNAIDLLKYKNKSFKGYDVNKIKGGFYKLLDYLSLWKENTGYIDSHKTKPIIFHKGKFIGGFTELKVYLDNH